MSRVDLLIRRYERFVSLPWQQTLAGPQRVWFLVYDKADERRIRNCVGEFELATKRAGHEWKVCDLSDTFAQWMATQEYRDSYFENPEDLELLLPEFREAVVGQIRDSLNAEGVGEDTVVVLVGIACLFGFLRASSVVQEIAPDIKGRLLLFFPGEYENNNYRLLDARDGWNYLAVPITAYDRVEE